MSPGTALSLMRGTWVSFEGVGLANTTTSEKKLIGVGVQRLQHPVRHEAADQLLVVELTLCPALNVEDGLSKNIILDVDVWHRAPCPQSMMEDVELMYSLSKDGLIARTGNWPTYINAPMACKCTLSPFCCTVLSLFVVLLGEKRACRLSRSTPCRFFTPTEFWRRDSLERRNWLSWKSLRSISHSANEVEFGGVTPGRRGENGVRRSASLRRRQTSSASHMRIRCGIARRRRVVWYWLSRTKLRFRFVVLSIHRQGGK